MSNPRKALGRALEHQVADRAVEAGFDAQLQPLSGILPAYPNDVFIPGPVNSILVEAKVRSPTISGGEKYITINLDWLKKCIANLERLSPVGRMFGAVVFRAKRSQDLYVLLRYEDFLQILKHDSS